MVEWERRDDGGALTKLFGAGGEEDSPRSQDDASDDVYLLSSVTQAARLRFVRMRRQGVLGEMFAPDTTHAYAYPGAPGVVFDRLVRPRRGRWTKPARLGSRTKQADELVKRQFS